MRIYLNSSALNRPFDDKANPRIQVEAEAVLAILRAVEADQVHLVSSEFVEVETEQGPPGDRAERIHDVLRLAHSTVRFSNAIATRALELAPAGLRGFDAMHIASAEYGRADLLITADDRMVRRSRRVKPPLVLTVLNPLDAVRLLVKDER